VQGGPPDLGRKRESKKKTPRKEKTHPKRSTRALCPSILMADIGLERREEGTVFQFRALIASQGGDTFIYAVGKEKEGYERGRSELPSMAKGGAMNSR